MDEPVATKKFTGLVALRTKAEVDASPTTIKVYIAEIPIKSASKLLQCVQ